MTRKYLSIIIIMAALFITALPIFAQDANGMIDPAASLTLETPVRDLVMSADGQFIYAIEEGSGLLLAFTFDRENGTLTLLEGFPLDLSGISYQPAALELAPSGNLLYVVHEGFIGRSLLTPISVLSVNPATGAASAIDRFGIPSQSGTLNAISSDSSGLFITVTDSGSGALQVFRYTRPAIMEPAPVQTQTISLAPYRSFCTGVGPRLCYLATIDGEEQLFYSEIEGFDYEWGTAYELRVRVEPVANPPADASSLRYILEEVISAEAAPADFTFEISLPPSLISDNGDGTFTFLGEQTFTCEEGMCTEIRNLLNGTESIELVMRFPETAGDPLQARLKIER